jgi:putative FmdB family regulatory protein
MPIYEYKCPNGHLFESFHGMSDPGPQSCEVCGAAPLERVLHPVAVHYKGSGFYSTDYGRGGRKAAKESGSDSGSSDSSPGTSASGSSDGGKTSDSKSSSSADA